MPNGFFIRAIDYGINVGVKAASQQTFLLSPAPYPSNAMGSSIFFLRNKSVS